jgi:hypothetical protein
LKKGCFDWWYISNEPGIDKGSGGGGIAYHFAGGGRLTGGHGSTNSLKNYNPICYRL